MNSRRASEVAVFRVLTLPPLSQSNNLDPSIRRRKIFRNPLRAVLRAVVDDDQLEVLEVRRRMLRIAGSGAVSALRTGSTTDTRGTGTLLGHDFAFRLRRYGRS